MKRNPQDVDEEGVPICYGRFDDLNNTCTDDCPSDLADRCKVEKEKDTERTCNKTNDITDKPECFGTFYSKYSEVCQDECSFKYGCRREKTPSWKVEAISDVISDRVRLPMLQEKPPSVIDPPVRSWSKPINYWDTYRPTPSYSQSQSPQTTNIQIVQNRPNLSEEQYLEFYNAVPAKNALVSGQFEGETWYSRLGKEFVLRTIQYAVHVAGQLIIEMISRIRWSPK